MLNKKMLAAAAGTLICSATVMSGSAFAADGAALYEAKTCIACHGAEGKTPAMNAYPKLAGQHEGYLVAQMQIIKSGARSNSHSISMKNIMGEVSDAEMITIAKWLASRK